MKNFLTLLQYATQNPTMKTDNKKTLKKTMTRWILDNPELRWLVSSGRRHWCGYREHETCRWSGAVDCSFVSFIGYLQQLGTKAEEN